MASNRTSGTSADEAAVPRPRTRRRVLTAVGLTVVVVVAVLGLVLFTPLLDSRVDATQAPASSYEEAMVKAEALLASDGPGVNPVCRSRVYDQGERTEQAVVLLHGFTNCPQQFEAVAQAYADAGYSVVVPRLPGHGDADRLSRSLSAITPGQVADVGDVAVDIAAGLGEQVRVVGLSGGGTLAAWLASQRSEVTEATLIAPLVVPKVLPEFAVGPVARAFRFAPDVYLWWDSVLKADLATPAYAYPRYSLRSLGAFLALGRDVQGSPAPKSLERLVVVSNGNDAAVSNAGVDAIADALTSDGVQRVDKEFAEELGYRHDLVDPDGENADRLAEIYPQLGPVLDLPDLSTP